MTDQARPSTLNEINRQLAARMYELMNFSSPRTWTDPRRVIYSPVDDLDYALELFMGGQSKERPEHMLIPFGYFTRFTGQAVGDSFNFARRPYAEWLSTKANEFPRADVQIKLIPAVLQYLFKIYDNRVEKTESLIDIFLHKTIREKTRSYRYDSSVLGINVRYRVELGNPQYDRTPSLKERLGGRGRVYSITLPFQVYCFLGESAPVKRIHEIHQNYWLYDPSGPRDHRGRPKPPPDYFLDKVVIDSNTHVGEI